jgi:hypothetical protein
VASRPASSVRPDREPAPGEPDRPAGPYDGEDPVRNCLQGLRDGRGRRQRRGHGNRSGRAKLLTGRDAAAFIDIDSMQKRAYGREKRVAFGHTKIQGKAC